MKHAVDMLERADAKILGIVLNRIDGKENAYGKRGHYGRYGRYSQYSKYGRYGYKKYRSEDNEENGKGERREN